MSCGCNSGTTNGIKGLSGGLSDYISHNNNNVKTNLGNISDSLKGVAVNFDFTTILLMAGAFAGGWYLTKKKVINW